MMDRITYWIKEDNSVVRLGLPPLTGTATDTNSLAVPMMLLCLIDQLERMDPTLSYDELADWCLAQTLAHIQVLY